jgi:hypothetical protein
MTVWERLGRRCDGRLITVTWSVIHIVARIVRARTLFDRPPLPWRTVCEPLGADAATVIQTVRHRTLANRPGTIDRSMWESVP